MANLKPLPELPNTPDRSPSPTPTTLSTEFRSHRSGLLRNAFGEVGDEGIAKRGDAWVHVFEEVLDQLNIEQCSIMAHSAGAPYAMAFANKHPERIRGELCLLAPWVAGGEGGGSISELRYEYERSGSCVMQEGTNG